YDNALLSIAYLDAYQITHNPEYKKIVIETLDYIKREMTTPKGGFYSSQDADSEGEEGVYYIWTPDQIEKILGKKDGKLFNKTFGITTSGNFEGKNIPRVSEKISDPDKINRMLVKLRTEREKRVHPAKDTKIITAWNGLMISAFARSAPVFENNDFLTAAQNAADFILSNLVENGKLYHSYSQNKKSGSGYLDDYVYFIEGLIDLYEADFNVKWLKNAEKLADSLISDFWYNDDSCFNYASDNHKNVLVKFRPSYDQALPSGNAVAAMSLQRLSILTGKGEYKEKAERILKRFQNDIKKSPRGFCFMLCAMDFYLHGATEIAIIGLENKKEVFSVIYNIFLPNKIIAFSENADGNFLPLLKNKKIIDGKITVYLCKDYQCKAPVTSIEELKESIRSR
ncbi:thioredoxin domain-containing protein, partial [bacterium]|nr:thioredoxin domain-containing protein [bacterium]